MVSEKRKKELRKKAHTPLFLNFGIIESVRQAMFKGVTTRSECLRAEQAHERSVLTILIPILPLPIGNIVVHGGGGERVGHVVCKGGVIRITMISPQLACVLVSCCHARTNNGNARARLRTNLRTGRKQHVHSQTPCTLHILSLTSDF
jgi:hypothetical protein